MKFAINTAFFLAACAAPAFASTKVNLAAKCKGFNINKLSVTEQTIVAHALESSYNDIHGAADMDDSELSDVHYGRWASTSDFLQQGG